MRIVKFLTIIGCIAIFVSCIKGKSSGSRTLFYYNDSKIDTTADNTINSGNFTVFEYNYAHPESERIADDEIKDKIIFQIPASETSFSLKDDAITKAVFKRWRYCYCLSIGPFPNIGGNISGTKQNNSWVITGFIKVSNSENIDLSGTYILK